MYYFQSLIIFSAISAPLCNFKLTLKISHYETFDRPKSASLVARFDDRRVSD